MVSGKFHWKKEGKAQLAVWDAILFFIVLMIASLVVLTYSRTMSHQYEVSNKQRLDKYAYDSFEALLKTTIDETTDGNTPPNTLYNRTVLYLTLYELHRLYTGGAPGGDILNDIDTVTRDLVQSEFSYAYYAEYDTENLLVSDTIALIDNLPDDRSSHSASYTMIDALPGDATITLHVWKSG